jgi:hypothetical protein
MATSSWDGICVRQKDPGRGSSEDLREPSGCACLMINPAEKGSRLPFLTHEAMPAARQGRSHP